jgi:hypothetical protein
MTMVPVQIRDDLGVLPLVFNGESEAPPWLFRGAPAPMLYLPPAAQRPWLAEMARRSPWLLRIGDSAHVLTAGQWEPDEFERFTSGSARAGGAIPPAT